MKKNYSEKFRTKKQLFSLQRKNSKQKGNFFHWIIESLNRIIAMMKKRRWNSSRKNVQMIVIAALNSKKKQIFELRTKHHLKCMCALSRQWEINFLWTSENHLVLKDNTHLNDIVYNDVQLLAHSSGNTLHVDKSYRHLSGIEIQRRVKRKQGYCCTKVISNIFTQCKNCYLCNHRQNKKDTCR